MASDQVGNAGKVPQTIAPAGHIATLLENTPGGYTAGGYTAPAPYHATNGRGEFSKDSGGPSKDKASIKKLLDLEKMLELASDLQECPDMNGDGPECDDVRITLQECLWENNKAKPRLDRIVMSLDPKRLDGETGEEAEDNRSLLSEAFDRLNLVAQRWKEGNNGQDILNGQEGSDAFFMSNGPLILEEAKPVTPAGYHKQGFVWAHKHIKAWYFFIKKNPGMPHKDVTATLADENKQLSMIWQLIAQENRKNGEPADYGNIDIERLSSRWRSTFSMKPNYQGSDELLKEECQRSGWPEEWQYFPPRYPKSCDTAVPNNAITSSAMPENTVSDNAMPSSAMPENTVSNNAMPENTVPNNAMPSSAIPNSTVPNNTMPNNTMPNNTMPNNTMPNNTMPNNTMPMPTSSMLNSGMPENIMPNNSMLNNTMPMPTSSMPTSSMPTNSMPTSSMPTSSMPTSSMKQSFQSGPLPMRSQPHTVKRINRPGYTASGERIVCIQPLSFGARFVVCDDSGEYRLESSAAAGGQPAITGAKNAQVPETTRDEITILKLKALVASCTNTDKYGVSLSAIGNWEPAAERLPFIIVLFYVGQEQHWVSRSTLGKLLGTKQADLVIAESLTGAPSSSSLKQVLHSRWMSQYQQMTDFQQVPRQMPQKLPQQMLQQMPPQMPQQMPPQMLQNQILYLQQLLQAQLSMPKIKTFEEEL